MADGLNREEMLETLESLIGIGDADSATEMKLLWMLDSATARLKLLLGGIEPPKELQHIIIEVAIIRFNRIGSEGMDSHTVAGESSSYSDNDFSGFMDEIEAFLDIQKETKRGRLRFI